MRLRRSLTPPLETIVIDDLAFRLRWSKRRASIGITVTRGGELRVAAPCGTPPQALAAVIREKLPWVRRKLAEFAALGEERLVVRLADGELLPYRGRGYEVSRVASAGSPVRLYRGRLEIVADLDGQAPAALLEWYLQRARARVEARLAYYAPRVGAQPAGVVVRDLGRRRWGVCDCRRRVVTLHWQLITLPPGILDYVLVHELCHLLVPNHSPAFWQHVGRVLPQWKTRRHWLALHGKRLTF